MMTPIIHCLSSISLICTAIIEGRRRIIAGMSYFIQFIFAIFLLQNCLFESIAAETQTLKGVSYYLYTRNDPTLQQELFTNDEKTLDNSYYSKNNELKLIIHGWRGSGDNEYSITIKNVFLSKFDVNVIIIDWSYISYECYETVAEEIPHLARNVSEFIDWLTGLPGVNRKIHIVAFSLGAHISGYIGRNVKNMNISQITSLDPAKADWETSPNAIKPSDADYVEIIHTGTASIGFTPPAGHNDFYPNGGTLMPGCEESDIICTHARAWEYYAESLDHQGFMANKCDSYAQMESKNCSTKVQLYMGGSKPKKRMGIFYLETNPNKPYYKNDPIPID